MHADTWASSGPFSLGSDASESLRRAGPQKARPGIECRVTIASRHNASTRPAGTALRACSRRGGASCAQAAHARLRKLSSRDRCGVARCDSQRLLVSSRGGDTVRSPTRLEAIDDARATTTVDNVRSRAVT
eukprot:scaffold12620_cov84-Phaeocystis_antarctica.AAC.2